MIIFEIGRRTYEGLDEEPMMDVDYDEEYDNDINGQDQPKDLFQGLSKRMKQSPVKKR